MREMSNVFAGLAALVLTGKTFFWLCNIMNGFLFVALFVSLMPVEDDKDRKTYCSQDMQDETKNLTIWAMITSLVAFVSLICFT